MNEFDDRQLEDALRRRAGAATDGYGIEAARSAVVARAGRVRRRRAAAAGGLTMAGLIAAAVLVIGPGTDSVVTTPSDTPDGSAPAPVDTPARCDLDPTEPERTAPAQDVIDTTRPPTPRRARRPRCRPSCRPPTFSTSAPRRAHQRCSPQRPSPRRRPRHSRRRRPTTPAPANRRSTRTRRPAARSRCGGTAPRWTSVRHTRQPGSTSRGRGRPRRSGEGAIPGRHGGDVRIEIRVENGQIVRVE